MTKLIYSACDGNMSAIKALEGSSYWDFCAFLNNYLERIEIHNKEMEKMKRENNLGSGNRSPVKRQTKSVRKK